MRAVRRSQRLQPASALAEAAEARRETPLLLANCAEATSRATALLAQLRDFGRGGRGTVRRPAPLAPSLAGTLGLLRYRLPRGVTVHESYADVPDVVCVPAEINQVLINLMMNAIDALAPGGNLWLGLDRDGADVRIVVRDDGAGIAAEVLPHVFEPFVTTKRRVAAPDSASPSRRRSWRATADGSRSRRQAEREPHSPSACRLHSQVAEKGPSASLLGRFACAA